MAASKELDFHGKVVVITGAASGIAAATAIEFASQGALLSLIDINNLSATLERCAKAAATGTEPAPHQVNCAGILLFDSMLNPSLDVFDKVITNNVRSMYYLTSICTPHLLKTKGNIVNVASVCSNYYMDNYLSYTISKVAIEHLTRHAAAELGPHGVRVNSIHPGTIATNMVGDRLKLYDKIHALNRTGEPEEVAVAIAFLASPRNSFMTGSNVYCDGGMSIKRTL